MAQIRCFLFWKLYARPTVHNLRLYGRMRPSIMKFAAVHM